MEAEVRQGSARIRAAIGIGVTWAAAWGAAGSIVALGFLLTTGSRPDAPFPILASVFGFVGGLLFSGVLCVVERGHSVDQMSLPRFAAWGAVVGLVMSAVFVLAVGLPGDPAFLWNLAGLGPVCAVAGAGSAAGSLALARKAQPWRMLLAQFGAGSE